MKISREEALKIARGKTAKPITSGVDRATPLAAPSTKIKNAQKFTTICPYCAVGCGQIISVINGKIVNIEGDPEHPINQGSLCTKGNALYQIAYNDRRLTTVLYRAPGSDRWQKKSWDWALSRIARRIKDTRDKNWTETERISDFGFRNSELKEKNPSILPSFQSLEKPAQERQISQSALPKNPQAQQFIVNRTEAIACLGGAALDNEECYLYSKLARALGIVYLEHQARI